MGREQVAVGLHWSSSVDLVPTLTSHAVDRCGKER